MVLCIYGWTTRSNGGSWCAFSSNRFVARMIVFAASTQLFATRPGLLTLAHCDAAQALMLCYRVPDAPPPRDASAASLAACCRFERLVPLRDTRGLTCRLVPRLAPHQLPLAGEFFCVAQLRLCSRCDAGRSPTPHDCGFSDHGLAAHASSRQRRGRHTSQFWR